MERPLAKSRLFGPFIQSDVFSNSSEEHNNDTLSNPPCDSILQRKGGLVRDMANKTGSQGKEQVVILVDVDGELLATDVKTGKEGSISRNTLANLSMDSSMLAIEERGGGKRDPTTIKEYEVHTHPEGHIDFSLRDLTSIGTSMNRGQTKNIPDGHFVAVKDEDKILLHGIYRTRELTEDEVSDIKSVAETVEAMSSSPITQTDKRQRMLDELFANGYQQCSSSIKA